MIKRIKYYFAISRINGLKDLREEFKIRSVLSVLSLKSKTEINVFRDSVRDLNKEIDRLEGKIK